MKTLFLLSLSIFLASISVNAQVFTSPRLPVIKIDPWINLRMGQIGNQMSADMARSKQAEKNRNAQTRTVTKGQPDTQTRTNGNSATTAVYKKEFSFVRSSDSPLAQKLAEGMQGNKVENLKQMNIMIGQLWNDYESSFQDENQRMKMPYNDLISSMIYFIEINYMIVHNIEFIEGEKSVAIYRQIADVLAKDDSLTKLSAQEKQLLSEAMVMMGAMPGVIYKNNRDINQLKQSAQQNLEKIFGDNVAKLKITNNGIEF